MVDQYADGINEILNPFMKISGAIVFGRKEELVSRG